MSVRNAIELQMFSGGRKVEDFSLDRPIITIGKLSNAAVRLTDPKVSRKHCVIERRADGRWRVTDLGSTHGTTVNGKRVIQTMLTEGDRLGLGDSELKIRFPDAPRELAKHSEPPPLRPANPVVGDRRESVAGNTLELAFMWGDTVLAVDHLDKPTGVLIGDAPGCRFAIPQELLGVASFPLIEEVDGDFALNLSNPALCGDVLRDESGVESFAELRDKCPGGRLKLGPSARVRISLGEFRILIRRSAPAKLKRASRWTAKSFRPWAFVAGSAILHSAFLIMLSYLPDEQLRSNLDPATRRAHMVQVKRLIDTKAEKPDKEKEKIRLKEKKPELDPDLRIPEAPAAALKRPNDKGETLISKLARRNLRGKKRSDGVRGPKKRRNSQEIARTAGAAKVLTETDQLDDLLAADRKVNMPGMRRLGSQGPGDVAVSLDPFGGGNRLLSPPGGWLPTDSVGDPGCVGANCKGTDRLVDITGTDDRDYSDVEMKRVIKEKAVPETKKGKVIGGRKKAAVDKKIRRLMSGIRGCYQTALQLNPKLTGRVKLRFAIPPSGRVTSVQVTSNNIADQTLKACIKRKVQRWRFGDIGVGAVARVTYPLLLKTSQSWVRNK